MIYSQYDPKFKNVKLGFSELTIGSHGCYLTAIANLAQVNPVALMNDAKKAKNGFQGALLVSSIIAELCDMKYDGATTSRPKGISIAVTNDNARLGIPTHFFILLADGRMIDPLTYPAKIEENKYSIVQYRKFSGIKLDPTDYEEDLRPWFEIEMDRAKERGLMNGERPHDNVTRAELATVANRLYNLTKSK